MRKHVLAAVAVLAIGGSAFAGADGQETLDALTNSTNMYTTSAGILLASQEVCGYPHAMLAPAISDLKFTGEIDDKKVVAIAYQLSIMADKDIRVKNLVCTGAMKMVNDRK